MYDKRSPILAVIDFHVVIQLEIALLEAGSVRTVTLVLFPCFLLRGGRGFVLRLGLRDEFYLFIVHSFSLL